jgi:hypothetical protein
VGKFSPRLSSSANLNSFRRGFVRALFIIAHSPKGH